MLREHDDGAAAIQRQLTMRALDAGAAAAAAAALWRLSALAASVARAGRARTGESGRTISRGRSGGGARAQQSGQRSSQPASHMSSSSGGGREKRTGELTNDRTSTTTNRTFRSLRTDCRCCLLSRLAPRFIGGPARHHIDLFSLD